MTNIKYVNLSSGALSKKQSDYEQVIKKIEELNEEKSIILNKYGNINECDTDKIVSRMSKKDCKDYMKLLSDSSYLSIISSIAREVYFGGGVWQDAPNKDVNKIWCLLTEKYYKVSYDNSSQDYKCTCNDFRFNSKKHYWKKTCSHVLAFKMSEFVREKSLP